ncbi:MAG: hypothetical protein AAF662_07795 [Pseudomonadota bacterium]
MSGQNRISGVGATPAGLGTNLVRRRQQRPEHPRRGEEDIDEQFDDELPIELSEDGSEVGGASHDKPVADSDPGATLALTFEARQLHRLEGPISARETHSRRSALLQRRIQGTLPEPPTLDSQSQGDKKRVEDRPGSRSFQPTPERGITRQVTTESSSAEQRDPAKRAKKVTKGRYLNERC